MTNEKTLALHERLAARHEMSVVEIANLAHAMVQAMIDPVEATGDAFVFQSQRARREPFGVNEDDFDLAWINKEVPATDARVDLIEALQQFKSDIERGQRILSSDFTIDDAVRVRDNHRAWFRFMLVRHPYPVMRAKFQEFLEAIEPLHERNKARARRAMNAR
jgi:hypothetical protein